MQVIVPGLLCYQLLLLFEIHMAYVMQNQTDITTPDWGVTQQQQQQQNKKRFVFDRVKEGVWFTEQNV